MIRLEYQIRNQSRGTNMDCSNLITSLRTNKHLNLEERFYLEKRLLAGDPINTIAKALVRSTLIWTALILSHHCAQTNT